MKLKKCPKCKSSRLGDRWCAGRKLQQYCLEDECDWSAKLRIPEQLPVTNSKQVHVGDFHGWGYTLYDKYGHVSTLSRTYDTEDEATQEMNHDLIRGEQDVNAGPYTGVLFYTPPTVTIHGKRFKCKNGVVYLHS